MLRGAEKAPDRQGRANLPKSITICPTVRWWRKAARSSWSRWRAQIDELKNRVGDAEKEFAATQARLAQERTDSENATRELTDARGRVENLSQRVTDLDRQLIIQVKEAEMLGNRVNDLERSARHPGQALGYRTANSKTTSSSRPMTQPERAAKELRVEIAGPEPGRQRADRRKIARDEKAAVEDRLRVAADERAKLQRDINAIQQQAESSWATERMENALLREQQSTTSLPRVAKLAIQLEEDRIRRSRPCWPRNRRRPKPLANDTVSATPASEGGGTLAERIRGPCSRTPPAPRQQGA